VEDEPLAVRVLTDYISQVPFLELRGTFKDALLASDYLRSNTADLIFLDINLPKLKGISFLKTLTNPPAVIITTAYHQYAVEGYTLNVTDYLLKPFEFQRFLIAVNKVRTSRAEMHQAFVDQRSPAKETESKDFVFINVQKKKVKVLFEEIIYIESQREYIKIVTSKNEFISKMSTHEIETILPTHLFRRVHRSFIISIRRIESYTAELVDLGGISIPIGKAYKDSLEAL
jgi:DNA-binding LytR/AlgR family response regulator